MKQYVGIYEMFINIVKPWIPREEQVLDLNCSSCTMTLLLSPVDSSYSNVSPKIFACDKLKADIFVMLLLF